MTTRLVKVSVPIAPCLTLGLALLAGCAGHGDYTTEGMNLAEARLVAVKAAAEYNMAEQAFLAGDLDKADRTLSRGIDLAPDVAKNHVLLGRLRLEQGRIGEAAAALERASELNTDLAEAHYYRGVVAERLRQPAAAADHFLAAAAAEPLDPQYVVAAAEALVDLDRLADAEATLMHSPVADHAPAVRQLLGHIAMIRGLPGEAADRFAEAALLAPDSDAIREDLVAALIASGRFARAEHELKRLLAASTDAAGNPVTPEGPRRDLLHMHGLCLVALGRPLEARQVYRDLTTGPDGQSDLDAWVGLGRASFLLGDTRTLKRAADRAVAVAPSQPDGAILQTLFHRSKGAPEDALAALDAFEGEPTTDFRTLRALVLADLGRFDDSRSELLAVLDQSPDDASAMRLLDRLPERDLGLDTFATAPTE